jgi:rod shape-determining protein MreD
MRGVGGLFRLVAVPALLAVLHFWVRPRFGDPRFTPDLLLLALLVLAMQLRPGAGAAVGFLVGLATDAVAPTAFGAAALAGTTVGFVAGWVRTLFVADNVLVYALFVFGAAWARDLIQVVTSNQLAGRALLWQLLAYSPAAALATALAGLVVFGLTGRWIREARA